MGQRKYVFMAHFSGKLTFSEGVFGQILNKMAKRDSSSDHGQKRLAM